MRGRRVLMESFVSHGVRHIFGNPGTTETPLLDSLPAFPQLDYIMALHEGVAVSAASFYAQASGRVAVANLHVAPGLGNGIGSIYGALKNSVVVTAGQQDTRMRRTWCSATTSWRWRRRARGACRSGRRRDRADHAARVQVATDAPQAGVRGAAIDVGTGDYVEASAPDGRSTRPDPAGIEALAALLLASKNPAIIAGDDVARSGGEQALVALTEAIGATVWFEGLRHHAPFPTNHPSYRQSLPGDARQVRKVLGDTDLVLLIGGPFFEDIWFAPGGHIPDGAVWRGLQNVSRSTTGSMPVSSAHRRQPRLDELAPGLCGLGSGRKSATRSAELQARERGLSRGSRKADRQPSSMPRVMAELRRGLPDNVIVMKYHGQPRSGAPSTITGLAIILAVVAAASAARRRDRRRGRGRTVRWSPSPATVRRCTRFCAVDGRALVAGGRSWCWRTAVPHPKHNVDVWRQNFEAGKRHPYQNMDITGPARLRISPPEASGGQSADDAGAVEAVAAHDLVKETLSVMAFGWISQLMRLDLPLPTGERSICQRVGAKRRPMINSANRVRGCCPMRDRNPSPGATRRPLPKGEVKFRCRSRST